MSISIYDIQDNLLKYYPQANLNLIRKAYEFSSKIRSEKSTTKEKDLIHSLSVAYIVTQMKFDETSIIAALLHDLIENKLAKPQDIKNLFGDDVLFLIEGVTELAKVRFLKNYEKKAESFRKMIIAMSKDIRVVLLKLADRLHTMKILDEFSNIDKEKVAQETYDIYAPLAHRLGVYWLKSELEDLSIKYLFPTQFQEIEKKLFKYKEIKDSYINEVVNDLKKLCDDNNIKAEISGRLKHISSIFKKMQKRNLDFEQIYDVIGFRIITDTVTHCYAVLGLIHGKWPPVPGKFKDYIALPKPNQYKSLHTTVFVPNKERIEIQIRTYEMHKIAEEGIAAHWQYKDGKKASTDVHQGYIWLRQLIEEAQNNENKEPGAFMESLKTNLFSDEVFVFSPKGELFVLPVGATPLDFAYAIHSNIGSHCTGGKVDGVLVPLRHKLTNGNCVEIMTSPNQHPSKDWLEFAVTDRAKKKIRNYILSQQREDSKKLGKEILEKEFRKYNLYLNKLIKSGQMDEVIQKSRWGSLDELFIQIASGKLLTEKIVEKLIPKEQFEEHTKKIQTSHLQQQEKTHKKSKSDKSQIVVDGIDDIMVSYAQCCNPIPGDNIIGYITRGKGLTIHRKGCKMMLTLPTERRIGVQWNPKSKTDRSVWIKIISSNKPGMLNNLSKIFTDHDINIVSVNAKIISDDKAISMFQFDISHLNELKKLMLGLQKISGVYSVERV